MWESLLEVSVGRQDGGEPRRQQIEPVKESQRMESVFRYHPHPTGWKAELSGVLPWKNVKDPGILSPSSEAVEGLFG